MHDRESFDRRIQMKPSFIMNEETDIRMPEAESSNEFDSTSASGYAADSSGEEVAGSEKAWTDTECALRFKVHPSVTDHSSYRMSTLLPLLCFRLISSWSFQEMYENHASS